MPIDYTGTTALVTGASSGLGAEAARRLAARGADLVLVARRADRLGALADELMAAHGITVTPLPLDLTADSPGRTLQRELAAREITLGTLVNNAGFGTYGPFVDADPARVADEVRLNVASLVDLSRAFLPQLVATGRGALVNVASTASFQPCPSMAVYGATKAFVRSFTEALWYETRGSGLRVLCLAPGSTRTEFFDVVGTDAASVGSRQSAQQVIDLALRTLDRRNPPPTVVSGRTNALSAIATRLLPARTMATVSGRILAPST
jgi:uncharacterized protein